MCKASGFEDRKPTDIPEDIDEEIMMAEDDDEEDEVDGFPEEFSWRLAVVQAASLDRDEDSDMDPDYEVDEENSEEEAGWAVSSEDEQEVQEALARFAEWKNNRSARQQTDEVESSSPVKVVPNGEKEEEKAEPEE